MKSKVFFLPVAAGLFLLACNKPLEMPPDTPPATPVVPVVTVPPTSFQVQFNKIYGGSSDDYALSIAASAGGGFVVAGSTWSNDGDVSGNHGSSNTIDGWILKLDTAGNIKWKKTMGGSKDDITYNIKVTPDGGYIIAGNTASNDGDVSGNHGNLDGWIIKLDSVGNIKWQKTLGGSGSDLFHCIVAGSDGSYAVVGFTSSNDGDVSGSHGAADAWVVKLDKNGSIIWQKALGDVAFDAAYSIVESPDGGYVIAGGTFSNKGDALGNHGGADAWVVKLDKNGNKVWQKTLGGSEFEEFRTIVASKTGGYVAAGYTRSNNGDVTGLHDRSDMWVVKLDETGNMKWQRTLGGTAEEDAYAVVPAADGGFVIAGDTYSHDGDVAGNNESRDGWIVKLDAAGNKVWQKTLAKSYVNRFQALIKNGEDFVGAGSSYSNAKGSVNNFDAWIATVKNQ